MSYKNDSLLTILSTYGKAGDAAKAELYETYDRLRDLTDSGPTLGGSGVGKFASLLMNFARMIGGSPFLPTFGSEAITVPGTSYYSPISPGTGITPGGQAAFGLAPWSQITGLTRDTGGGAAPIDGSSVGALSRFSAAGIGAISNTMLGFSGLGDYGYPASSIPGGYLTGTLAGGAAPIGNYGNGWITGGASGITSAAGTAAGLTAGGFAGSGFGQNWIMPAAGIVSGIGGLLTTLGPFFGPFGIAAAAGGAVLNGAAGAALSSFQHISTRILNNADTILSSKIKNLETTVKQLEAQEDVIKKLLKDSLEGDKKALDNI